jgi:hypothetical protein
MQVIYKAFPSLPQQILEAREHTLTAFNALQSPPPYRVQHGSRTL